MRTHHLFIPVIAFALSNAALTHSAGASGVMHSSQPADTRQTIPVKAQSTTTQQSAAQVAFHDAKGTREYAVIEKLYSPFIKKYPNVLIQSSVLSLGNTYNGKPVGAIAIRFSSPMTCQGNACLTSVLTYGSNGWRESYSRHTAYLITGGVSPAPAGDGVKKLMDSTGLVWRWIGIGAGYFPDMSSIGKMWPNSKGVTDKALASYAIDNPPDGVTFSDPKLLTLLDRSVSLNGETQQHIIVYNTVEVCSHATCPFSVITGDAHSGYRTIGSGLIGNMGATLPNKPDKNGQAALYAPFVVQAGDGTGLAFYSFHDGFYRPYLTTWPTPITEIP